MERADELDIALLRQMEREILLDTVYDERRLSDAELKSLLKERSVRALYPGRQCRKINRQKYLPER